MGISSRGLLVLALLISPQSANQLDDILRRVGERVQHYTNALLSVVATEVAQQQELEPDLKTVKKKRAELVYDFMIVRPKDSPRILERRELKLMDGKPVKKGGRPPAPDPTAYTTSLLFLSPVQQARYAFSYGGTGDLEGRDALIVDYTPARRQPPNVTWQGRFFRLNFQSKGRIWIDPSTYDVLRLETHLIEPFEFKSPRITKNGLFFRFGPSRKFKVETWDVTMQFRPTSFSQPESTLLLPVAVESVQVIDGSRVPRSRTTHSFSNYKRFTSDIKIGVP